MCENELSHISRLLYISIHLHLLQFISALSSVLAVRQPAHIYGSRERHSCSRSCSPCAFVFTFVCARTRAFTFTYMYVRAHVYWAFPSTLASARCLRDCPTLASFKPVCLIVLLLQACLSHCPTLASLSVSLSYLLQACLSHCPTSCIASLSVSTCYDVNWKY